MLLCGTPNNVFCGLEVLFPSFTFCNLFSKYDLNHRLSIPLRVHYKIFTVSSQSSTGSHVLAASPSVSDPSCKTMPNVLHIIKLLVFIL